MEIKNLIALEKVREMLTLSREMLSRISLPDMDKHAYHLTNADSAIGEANGHLRFLREALKYSPKTLPALSSLRCDACGKQYDGIREDVNACSQQCYLILRRGHSESRGDDALTFEDLL